MSKIKIGLGIFLVLAIGVAIASTSITGTDLRTEASQTIKMADADLTHVMFLAGWCPPCLDQLETLRDWENRYTSQGYQLVVVAVSRRQNIVRVRKLVRDHEIPGTVLFDSDGSIEASSSVTDLPFHQVFDSTGQLIWSGNVLDDEARAKIEAALEARDGTQR